jgi:hypothetical protein
MLNSKFTQSKPLLAVHTKEVIVFIESFTAIDKLIELLLHHHCSNIAIVIWQFQFEISGEAMIQK